MPPAPTPDHATVWWLLSELYLDTDHDERALRALAAELARSPFSIAELHEIEYWEVAPVLWSNLCIPAGVWSAFDATWLETQCARYAARKPWWLRLASVLGWKRFVDRTTGNDWKTLEPAIAAERVRLAIPNGSPIGDF